MKRSLPAVLSIVLATLTLAVPPASATATVVSTIVVLGDSLSAGHGIDTAEGWVNLLRRRLQERGYPYRVINASISGDTTSGGLQRLPSELKRYRPAILILELGGNDGLRGTPLAVMRHNLLRLIELARHAGARVMLLGVRLPPNYGPAYVSAFEGVYREVAKQTHTPLVAHLLQGVATHRSLMQSDGIHPTAAAQPRLLDNVWPVLKPLLHNGRPKSPQSIP